MNRLVDLSHRIEAGMTTYKGLPGPHICDYWEREASRVNYDDGSTFQIGRIDMVANTGTYLDAPFHRYADGEDLAALELKQLASLPGLVVRASSFDPVPPNTPPPRHTGEGRYPDSAPTPSIEPDSALRGDVSLPPQYPLAVDAPAFEPLDVAGKAVLIHTGWDRHWRTQAYFHDHPFLTEAAARLLAERGARLVGIDSHNIDDTRTRSRPVHTILLGAGILVCEHMTNLAALPDRGFTFTAVPPKIAGMGTFPVRAFAETPE